ncbi:MAG TPA: FxLYD domain-containing protein [Terriglobales bacterium]|nr:FxLYD domain-containing protein [Terriglobales bacterium]
MNAMRVLIAVLVLAAAGCAGGASAVSPSASVTTAMQGWEHYFALDYAAGPGRDGNDVEGYVYNKYGSPMAHVQILAQALDGTGNVVGQRLAWVHGVVPPLNRSYFRVGGLPPAPRYRATVWAFDIVQGGGIFER